MDGIGGGGGMGGGSMGGGGSIGGGSSLGSSEKPGSIGSSEKSSSSESSSGSGDSSSGLERGTKDSAKVGKPESKKAAQQSNKMVGGLTNSFSAIKSPERTPEQVEREKELFNRMADRVTPGSEGSFLQGATSAQEDAKELFQPEAKGRRDGSEVQERFNKQMEEAKRDARMQAKVHGKDHDLLDVSISNPVAGKKETIWGGFSEKDLK